MSHDCVADSGIQLIEVKNFLNLSADKFLVSIDRGPRFIGGIPFASGRGETQCGGNVHNVSSTRVAEFDFLMENLDARC